MTRMRHALLVLAPLLLLSGCFWVVPSKGGGQTHAAATVRRINSGDVALLNGYRIEAVATGLTYPTGVAFDEQNRPCVLEGGYSYGEEFQSPRLLRIEGGGRTSILITGADGQPWTGVEFDRGAFVIAQGGELTGGRIVRLSSDGKLSTLIENLPSRGDHHTNGPAIAPDGSIYFAVGTATNSGVVGQDNETFGWLKRNPTFHDIPAKDIKLTGENFKTGDESTGAFLPQGAPSQPVR
jgi:glucose/arabinose dehydrogenase